jgi:hypothetical protein
MRKWSFIGAGVVLLAAIVAFIWWITAIGAWPIVRDIVIVLAAMLNLAVTILLAAAVIYLALTLINLKRELTPVLESLQSTTQSVSATAKVTSDLGVAPTVRTASVLVGAAEVASAVLGRGQTRARAQRRAQRRQEVEREMAARGELNGH